MKQVIWEAQLDDGKYDCKVERIGDDQGLLTVIEQKSGKTLFTSEVHLSYGAAFGVDVFDISDWQEMICRRILK